MEYKVRVWDNFHYGDEDESYNAGTYSTYEQAVAAAKSIVLEFLRHEYKPGMTPEQLYSRYTDFGEDSSVYPEEPSSHFSAWEYAKSMCKEICEELDVHSLASSDQDLSTPQPSPPPKKNFDPDNPTTSMEKLVSRILAAFKTPWVQPQTQEKFAARSSVEGSSSSPIGAQDLDGQVDRRESGRQHGPGRAGGPPHGLVMGRIWMIAELMVRDHFVMTHQGGAPCQVWAKDWRGESAVVCIFSLTSTLHQICYIDTDTAAV